MKSPEGPTRDHESVALAAVAAITGATWDWVDTPNRQGSHDADLHLPNGSVEALEITSAPAHEEIRENIVARRKGRAVVRGGRVDLNSLTGDIGEHLSQSWCLDNVAKLGRAGANRTNLFLLNRSNESWGLYATACDLLPLGDLNLPPGLDTLWLLAYGGGVREGICQMDVLRFSTEAGWAGYYVELAKRGDVFVATAVEKH